MPHIIIEKSQDISKENSLKLTSKIQTEMSKIEGGNFSLEACKGRIFEFDEYFVGSKTQENSSFFHITIKILEGRSSEIKLQLAKKIGEISTEFLKNENINKERIDLSVDIVDMDKETYQKISL